MRTACVFREHSRQRPNIYLYIESVTHSQFLFAFNRARTPAAVQVHLTNIFVLFVRSGKHNFSWMFFSPVSQKSKDNNHFFPFIVKMFGSRKHENYAINFLESFFLFSHKILLLEQ